MKVRRRSSATPSDDNQTAKDGGASSVVIGSPANNNNNGRDDEDDESDKPLLERKENAPYDSIDESWFPLFQDKVRGGVRSRTMLVLTYLYLTLLVGLFLVLALVVNRSRQDDIQFVAPPPSSLVSGVPISTISVTVRDPIGRPRKSAAVVLSILPVEPWTVPATVLGGDEITMGDVNCLSDSIFPYTRAAVTHSQLCRQPMLSSVENAALKAAATAVRPSVFEIVRETDAAGRASFLNVSWPAAFPGHYMVGVRLAADKRAVARRIVKVDIPKITVRAALANIPSQQVPPSATARRFYDVPRGSALNLTVDARLTLPQSLLTLAPEPETIGASVIGVDYIGAVQQQLDPFTSAVTAPFYFAHRQGATGVMLGNSTLVASLGVIETARNIPANNSGPGEIDFQLNFPDLTVVDSALPIFNLAVVVMGSVHAIDVVVSLEFDTMVPTRMTPPLTFVPAAGMPATPTVSPNGTLVTPLAVEASVTQVGKASAATRAVVCDGDATPVVTVTEGESITVTVRVTDSATGVPVSGLHAWAFLSHDPAVDVSVMTSEDLIDRKVIMQHVSPGTTSATSGEVSLSLATSVSGHVGRYRLHITAGGVEATWPSVTTAAASGVPQGAAGVCQPALFSEGIQNVSAVEASRFGTSGNATGGNASAPSSLPSFDESQWSGIGLFVNSSVTHATISTNFGPWFSGAEADVEYVYGPFRFPPTVTVFADAATGFEEDDHDDDEPHGISRPLRGKRAHVVSTDPRVVVSSWSTVSDVNGIISLGPIITSMAAPDGTNVTFEVIVDGVVRGTFRRRILFGVGVADGWPAAIAVRRALVMATDACAVVRPLLLEPSSHKDDQVLSVVYLKAVSVSGAPVPNAGVVLSFDAATTPRYLDRVLVVQTNASGVAEFIISARGVTYSMVLKAFTYCSSVSDVEALVFATSQSVLLNFNSRVRMARVFNETSTGISVYLDVDWRRVSADRPISVTDFPVWSPGYITSFYSTIDRANTSVLAVLTGPPAAGNSIHLDIVPSLLTIPGLAMYGVFVDSTSLNAHTPRQFPVQVESLEIIRSAIANVPSAPASLSVNATGRVLDLDFGVALPVQPIIRALDSNGNGIRGVRIFAELGVGNATSVRWFDTGLDGSVLQFGLITDSANAAIDSVVPASPIAITDANGDAAFVALTIDGAVTQRELRLRYCYAVNVPRFTTGRATLDTVCVNEAEVFEFPAAQAVVAVATPAVIVTTPGADLPLLTVTTTTASTSYFARFATVVGNTYLTADENIYRHAVPLPRGTVTLPYGALTANPNSPSVATVLEVYVPGAVAYVAVTVSKEPTALTIAVEPPDFAAVDEQQVIAARVTGAGDNPLPNVRVSVTPRWSPYGNDDTCVTTGCGVQSPLAVTSSTTDANGFVQLIVDFGEVTSGNFSYAFVIDPEPSAVSQLETRLLADVTFLSDAVGGSAGVLQLASGSADEATVTLEAVAAQSLGTLTTSLTDVALDPDVAAALSGTALGASASLANAAGLPVPTAASLTVETSTIVFNPVAKVLIINPGSLDVSMGVPQASTLNTTWRGVIELEGSAAAVFRLIDAAGAGVPSTPLTVELVMETGSELLLHPPGGSLEVGRGALTLTSDANGYVTLDGAYVSTIDDIATGHYRARSRGSPLNETADGSISFELTRTRLTRVLEQYSFFLVLLFTPMFISSVAHSRPYHLAAGTIFTIVMFIIVVVFLARQSEDVTADPMVGVYFTALIIVAAAAAVGMMIISATQLIGWIGVRRWRVWNSEERVVAAFKYTVWMVNARVDKQEIEPDPPTVRQRLRMAAIAMKKAAHSVKLKVSNAFADEEEPDPQEAGDDDNDGLPDGWRHDVDGGQKVHVVNSNNGFDDEEHGQPRYAKDRMEMRSLSSVASNRAPGPGDKDDTHLPQASQDDDDDVNASNRAPDTVAYQSVQEDTQAKELSARLSTKSGQSGQLSSSAVEGNAAGDNPFATSERPALRRPDDVPDPTFYPTNIFVVFAITIVVITLLVYYTLTVMFDLDDLLTRIEHTLPPTPTDPAVARNATRKITDTVSVGLEALAQSDPDLVFLRELIGPIRQFDWVTILGDVRTFVAAVNERVLASFVTGVVVGVTVIIAVMVYTFVVTPGIIRSIRRGEYRTVPVYDDPQPWTMEQFIGLFVFHFAAVYMMAAFIIIILVWILTVDIIRNFILERIFTALIASLGSLLLTVVLRIMQQFFLMDGTYVIRPKLYAMYAFIDLVLGVFTGLINTVVRLAMAVGFIIVSFAKLDETVFPALFAWLDTGLIGYSTLLTMEANNANPIFVSFASYLLTDQAVRRTVAQHQARKRLLQELTRHGGNEETAAADEQVKERQRVAILGFPRWVAEEVRDLVKEHLAEFEEQREAARTASVRRDGDGVRGMLDGTCAFDEEEDEEKLAQQVVEAVETHGCCATVGKAYEHLDSRVLTVEGRVVIDMARFGSQRLTTPGMLPGQTGMYASAEQLLKLPYTAPVMPSPLMIVAGRLWLRWLMGEAALPLEPWLDKEAPDEKKDQNNDGEPKMAAGETRPRRERKTDSFDATEYLRCASRRSRWTRKWHLAVTLLRNPSLVKYRKHWLPKARVDARDAELDAEYNAIDAEGETATAEDSDRHEGKTAAA